MIRLEVRSCLRNRLLRSGTVLCFQFAVARSKFPRKTISACREIWIKLIILSAAINWFIYLFVNVPSKLYPTF